MLIIALVLAVIGLAALVTAVVTSNELIAWVCIGASVIGVLLLIVDALRERSRSAGLDESEESDGTDGAKAESTAFAQPEPAEDYPEEHEPEVQEPDIAEDADTAAAESDEHDDETSRSKAD
jgi:hypothetical protein